jgi:hypothetical protein
MSSKNVRAEEVTVHSEFMKYIEEKGLSFDEAMGEVLIAITTLAEMTVEKANSNLLEQTACFRIVAHGAAYSVDVTKVELAEVMAQLLDGVSIQ